ncbi:MAG TPA: hypothetical protein VLJ57_16975 [Burkholderiaceae bacterium]|nr:hypothetical protein [Burkholderiaceae bacterium]
MQTAHPRNTRPMHHPFRTAAGLCALALAWSATAPAALAKTREDKPAYVSAAKSKRPGKVKFDNGSGESTAERERRLLRECRGRPNAGACLGYTS